MAIYVVAIGNTSVRIEAGDPATAILRAKQYFPGLHARNRLSVGTSVRIEGDNDGGIQFVSPNDGSLDKYRAQIIGASGLSGGGVGGVGGDGGVSSVVDVPDDISGTPLALEQQTPLGAFRRFLGGTPGLGINDPRSAGRTFARGQFNPNYTAFLGSQLGGSLGGEAFDAENPIADRDFGNEFANFLGSGSGTFNPRQRLADAFRSIRSAAQTGPNSGTFLSRSLNPQDARQAQLIGQLGQDIQRSSVSPLLSQFFTPQSNEDIFADFRGGAGGNFQDFVARRFGLGQLGF